MNYRAGPLKAQDIAEEPPYTPRTDGMIRPPETSPVCLNTAGSISGLPNV